MYSAMIVEDHKVFRRQIKSLSCWGEDMGFEIVAEAGDGLEALDYLRNHHVDLLLTDIRMPVMDGLQLLRVVREEALVEHVVFLTDHSDFKIAKEAISLGVEEYLLKPVDSVAIEDVLMKISAKLTQQAQAAEELARLKRSVEEAADMFYPADDVRILVQTLGGERDRVGERCQNLVRLVQKNYDGESVKCRSILVRALSEIRESYLSGKPWLKQILRGRDDALKATIAEDAGQEALAFCDALDAFRLVLENLDPGETAHPLVEEIKRTVADGVNQALTQDGLSQRLHLSKKHLGEVFKTETGMSLGNYMTTVKMHWAAIQLRDTGLKIYEIAELLGYSDEYFAKLFKSIFGCTPMQYRKKEHPSF